MCSNKITHVKLWRKNMFICVMHQKDYVQLQSCSSLFIQDANGHILAQIL